jgi:GTP-binding protein HflX
MTQMTYETERMQPEKAVIVSFISRQNRETAQHSLDELRRLAESAGVSVVGSLTQQRGLQDARWLIGKGKAEELRQMAAELSADLVIFDQELSPAQVRNLEHVLQVKLIDRTQLILDIFAQRAKTREGKLQVELAQLEFLLPRLSGHGKHLSRQGGGIGTRGPGETKLETDRRHIRRRIGELNRQLRELHRHRKLYRSRRREAGLYQIALVGYTNAGKSTLLKRLTGADTLAENRLFATLDPLSRIMELPDGKKVLLTDTVGFIRNLPHELVAAFRSTLEEVCEADLLLHVVDGSAPDAEQHIRVVQQTLADLGAQNREQVTVFTKKDLAQGEVPLYLAQGDALSISAFDEHDLRRLKEMIAGKLPEAVCWFRVPYHEGKIVSLLHRSGEMLLMRNEEEHMLLKVRFHQPDFEKIRGQVHPFICEGVPHEVER